MIWVPPGFLWLDVVQGVGLLRLSSAQSMFGKRENKTSVRVHVGNYIK